MVKKSVPAKKAEKTVKPALGAVVMVHTRSSSHWCAMTQPAVLTIEGYQFLAGTQVTGKPGHRLEGKRTLIPLEHVASIVEFETEEDLWSEPQAKLLRPAEDTTQQNALLTSHEQNRPQNPHHQGGGRNRNHGRRHEHGKRYQGGGDDDFRGGRNFNR